MTRTTAGWAVSMELPFGLGFREIDRRICSQLFSIVNSRILEFPMEIRPGLNCGTRSFQRLLQGRRSNSDSVSGWRVRKRRNLCVQR